MAALEVIALDEATPQLRAPGSGDTYTMPRALSVTGGVTTERFTLSGNISAAAWTTSGIGLRNVARTITDTTSSGTVAQAFTNVLGGNTIAASSATTFTDYASLSVGLPAAGTNVTMTNRWALDLGGGLRSTGQSLTGSQAQSLVSLAATWNTTGAPDLISATVTITAANNASRLLNLTAGNSHIRFTPRTGTLSIRDNEFSGAAAAFEGGTTGTQFRVNGTTQFQIRAGVGTIFDASQPISFGNASAGTSSTSLREDAANTLALRNGTNAQTSRVYGTFTDASNGRWLNISMTTAGVATITPTGNGTGASGNVIHISGLPTSNPGPGILWNNAGTPAIGT